MELREGTQHSADVQHDRERQVASGQPVAFLIKWNRRGHDLDALFQLHLAEPQALWDSPRPGKRVSV